MQAWQDMTRLSEPPWKMTLNFHKAPEEMPSLVRST